MKKVSTTFRFFASPRFLTFFLLILAGVALAPAQAADSSAPPAASPAIQSGPAPSVTLSIPAPRLSGLFQFWSLYDLDAPDAFRIRRSEVKFSGDMNSQWSYVVMFDAAKKLAPAGPDFSILQDAYVAWKPADVAAFKLGQFKIPVTEESLRSSAKIDTIERSQIARTFGDKRDIGFQTDISLPMSKWALGFFNGEGPNVTETNDFKDFGGRVVITPLPMIEAGASFYDGKVGVAETLKRRAGWEVRYLGDPVRLNAEYMDAIDGTTGKNGYYVQGVYKMHPNLSVVVKYDILDPDKNIASNSRQEITSGFIWQEKGSPLTIHGDMITIHDDGAALKDERQFLLAVQFTPEFNFK